jgi:hypothetical protein
VDYQACLLPIRALAVGTQAFAAALERMPPEGGEDLPAFLLRHRLVHWVEPALGDERVRRALPEAFLSAAEQGRPARHARTARLLADCLEIREASQRAGLPCLLLKGLGFGQRYYGDIHRRHQQDVDVLVRAEDLPAAMQLFAELGYAPDEGRIGEGAVRRSVKRGESEVDIHWNLRRRARRRVDAPALWEARRRFALAGAEFETLGDEHTLLFLLLAMCGDLRRGACPVRCFLDLHLILRAHGEAFDWEAFLTRRRAEALEKPCVNVLAVHLAVWRTGAEHPRLREAVARRRSLVQLRDADEALAIVQRARGNPENPVWYQRAYPYDALGDWARRLTLDLPRTLTRLAPSRRFALPAG